MYQATACRVKTAQCEDHTLRNTQAMTTPWTQYIHSHLSRMQELTLAALEATMNHQRTAGVRATMKAMNMPSRKVKCQNDFQTSRLMSSSTLHRGLTVLSHLHLLVRVARLHHNGTSETAFHMRPQGTIWMHKVSGCLVPRPSLITVKLLQSINHSGPRQTQKSVECGRIIARLRIPRTIPRLPRALSPLTCHRYRQDDLCLPSLELQTLRSVKSLGH
jgi:hypothetical protein